MQLQQDRIFTGHNRSGKVLSDTTLHSVTLKLDLEAQVCASDRVRDRVGAPLSGDPKTHLVIFA